MIYVIFPSSTVFINSFSIDFFYLIIVYSLQGKLLTALEPGVVLNQLCVFPHSGLIFIANEAPKVLTYFIPVSVHLYCNFLLNNE